MQIEELEKEAKDAVKKFPFLKKMEVIDKHSAAIKFRLTIGDNFYIQVYCNSMTGTTNFVAIVGNQRIFGRDCDREGWHMHPFHDPDSHTFTPKGIKEMSLTYFLEELQEIIEKEKLL